MLQRFHATAPVVELLSDSRVLVAKTRRRELGAKKPELRMTGRASAVAKKEAAAIGWSVVEGAN